MVKGGGKKRKGASCQDDFSKRKEILGATVSQGNRGGGKEPFQASKGVGIEQGDKAKVETADLTTNDEK